MNRPNSNFDAWNTVGLLLLAGFLGIGYAALQVSGTGSTSTPDAFDTIAAKVYCEEPIKQLLNDPDSYRFDEAAVLSNNGAHKEYGQAVISFRARNGFGGYRRSAALCTAYDNNGTTWYRAQLQEQG